LTLASDLRSRRFDSSDVGLSLDGNVLTIDIPSFEFFDDIYRLVMVFRRG